MDKGFYREQIPDEIFEKMKGRSYKEGCPIPHGDLSYLHVLHRDLDGGAHEGELVCHELIAEDLLEIFEELFAQGYPIEKIRLIDEYDALDEPSMADNNSSAFNFRTISHTDIISKHGLGIAVDINPLYNPYIFKVGADGTADVCTSDVCTADVCMADVCMADAGDGQTPCSDEGSSEDSSEGGMLIIEPANGAPYADREADFAYKIAEGDLCLRLFREHGFEWGGDWTHAKDYQHFELPDEAANALRRRYGLPTE